MTWPLPTQGPFFLTNVLLKLKVDAKLNMLEKQIQNG
jgi:hypothetical protein